MVVDLFSPLPCASCSRLIFLAGFFLFSTCVSGAFGWCEAALLLLFLLMATRSDGAAATFIGQAPLDRWGLALKGWRLHQCCTLGVVRGEGGDGGEESVRRGRCRPQTIMNPATHHAPHSHFFPRSRFRVFKWHARLRLRTHRTRTCPRARTSAHGRPGHTASRAGFK